MDEVAAQFRALAPTFGSSPLSQALILAVADDEDLLGIAATIGRGQQRPNLILAAVQYLLLGGVDHDLKRWYRTFVDEPEPPETAGPAFRDFCLTHAEAMTPILAQRNVQTNVVKRCFALRYGLHLVARAGQIERGTTTALVEIGPSAGLLLRFDRYRYDVDGRTFGDPDSDVVLTTDWRARPVPDLDDIVPIERRVGIDLQPVDITDPDERRWLHALVWPEDRHKAALLDAALTLALRHPVDIVTGDAIERLDEVVDALPAATPVVVFHGYVLGHVPADRRPLFLERIRALGHRRTTHHLGLEGATLRLDGTVVADLDAHLEWIAPRP